MVTLEEIDVDPFTSQNLLSGVNSREFIVVELPYERKVKDFGQQNNKQNPKCFVDIAQI